MERRCTTRALVTVLTGQLPRPEKGTVKASMKESNICQENCFRAVHVYYFVGSRGILHKINGPPSHLGVFYPSSFRQRIVVLLITG